MLAAHDGCQGGLGIEKWLRGRSSGGMVFQDMSFTGIVENGKVVLPPEVDLPSGTKVRVETVDPEIEPLAKCLEEFIGVFNDLPSDFARNHDSYIHGADRR